MIARAHPLTSGYRPRGKHRLKAAIELISYDRHAAYPGGGRALTVDEIVTDTPDEATPDNYLSREDVQLLLSSLARTVEQMAKQLGITLL